MTIPAVFVVVYVITVGEGNMSGMAERFNEAGVATVASGPNIGLYVLVARAAETMPPVKNGTEVLREYAGVVTVGVTRREFGRVVATISEAVSIKLSTTEETSGVVVFDKG